MSLAATEDIAAQDWQIFDLTDFPLYTWEPTMDTTLWKEKNQLHLLVQNTGFPKNKSLRVKHPQNLYILELEPRDFLNS